MTAASFESWRAGDGALVSGALVVAAASGLMATGHPRYALALPLVLGVAAVMAVNPFAGLAVLLLLTFFEQMPYVADTGVTIVKLLGVLLTGAWLLWVLRRETPVLSTRLPLPLAGAAALTAWAALSLVWADDAGVARGRLETLVQVVLLFLITYSLVDSVNRLRSLLWVFVAGAALTSALGLISGATTSGGDRLIGGILDPNYLAALLVAATMFALFLFVAERRLLVRGLLIGVLVLYGSAFVLTQSRGGLAALAAALLAAVVVGGKARPWAILLGLLLAAGAIAFYGYLAPLEARQRVTDVSATGSAGRIDEWNIALQIASDHPWTGIGLGNYPVVENSLFASDIDLVKIRTLLETRHVVHNTYLELLSELGLVGIALFALTVGSTLIVLWRGAGRAAREGALTDELVLRGMLVGLIGLLAAYFFLSGEYQKQLWVLLGAAAAAGGYTGGGRARAHADRAT